MPKKIASMLAARGRRCDRKQSPRFENADDRKDKSEAQTYATRHLRWKTREEAGVNRKAQAG